MMPGVTVRNTMLCLGAAICPKCLAALELDTEARAAVLLGCKRADCYRAAVRCASAILTAWTRQAYEMLENPPPPRVMEPVMVGAEATVGEAITVYREHWRTALNSEVIAQRNTTSLLLVLAYAFDAWQVKVAGVGPKGVKVGERYADEAALSRLPLSALNAVTAKAYFVKRCAALGLPCSWASAGALEAYVTINSTMRMTRDLFRVKAIEHVYKGRVLLPSLTEWMEYPLLPEVAVEPEPIPGEVFARLVKESEALRESDPDLWLCARVMRQTGLRVGSISQMRDDWVVRGSRGWRLELRRRGDRKSGTAAYSVPITEETARAIQARPGFTFGEDAEARERLVTGRHNAFLKGIIGEPVRGRQGGHRLRDTLAGAVFDLLGLEAAAKALGHASDKVTLAHYARVPIVATAEMRAEYAAFLSVAASAAPVLDLGHPSQLETLRSSGLQPETIRALMIYGNLDEDSTREEVRGVLLDKKVWPLKTPQLGWQRFNEAADWAGCPRLVPGAVSWEEGADGHV